MVVDIRFLQDIFLSVRIPAFCKRSARRYPIKPANDTPAAILKVFYVALHLWFKRYGLILDHEIFSFSINR